MNRKIKFLASLIIAVIICTSLTVFAGTYSPTQVPYENYTYWEGFSGDLKKAVYSKAMYYAEKQITAQSVGTEKFNEIKDVFSGEDGKVYVLDSRASRIIILNSDYSLLKEFKNVTDGSSSISFAGASGIFVTQDGRIFIADTENARVLVTDNDGRLMKELGLPQSPLIPEGFEFRPTKIAVTSKNDIYILSDGSFYGALVLDNHFNFKGFYGSNTVKSSFADGVANLWNKLFMSDNKRENSEKNLPFQFTDLCMDKDGFIYTTTGKTESGEDVNGQIKKLSPAGNSILGGDSYNYADEGYADLKGNSIETRVQDLLSLDVDDNGYIFALDSTYGRVFVYSPESRLMTAFGGGVGKGTRLGIFTSACAVAEHNGDVLVCDSTNNNITVFSPTEYGIACMKANQLTSGGDYIAAEPLWKEIIAEDSNNQLAYAGLCKSYMANGDYKTALQYAKEGYDRELYDQAFSQVRKEFMNRHFALLFFGLVFLVAAIITAVVIIKKKKVSIIKNGNIRLLFETVGHPVLSFDRIKEKHEGSVLISTVLIIVYYAVTVLKSMFSGFSFNYFDESSFNALFILVRSVGAVLLWSICNWAVGSLFGGKGTLKEIYITVGYCLLPLIFGDAVYLAVSNILTSNEGAFLGIFSTIMILATAFYITVGMIRIHDYSFGEFVLTSILTVIGMILIIFFLFLVGVLLQQLAGFIITLVTELITVLGG